MSEAESWIALSEVPSVADERWLHQNGGQTADEEEEDSRVFLDIHEFASRDIQSPDALWGNNDVAAIPAGGLCLVAGRPGCGKTTLILDMACHLAAGLAWPPIDTENDRAPQPFSPPRPLRIAFIENEGPEDMFRMKVADKLTAFQDTIGSVAGEGGCIAVQSWRWGSFSFADSDAHGKAQRELEEQRIDLVMGDPLASLGPEGVGSPADTRNFVQLLRPLGLGTHRAFLFLHHFRERVERSEDELARISGAWGGHLDTLITLSSTSSADQARLAWPKLRWARSKQPNPIILGRLWEKLGFEALSEEGDLTILEPLIYAELADRRSKNTALKGWSTATDLAKALERRRVDVTKTLEGASHLFEMRTGEEAKALGGKKTTKLWGLKEWTQVESVPPEADQQEGIPF